MKKKTTKKVLIVDDELQTCQLISNHLTKYRGYKVYEAHNGAEGFMMLKKIKPDLIILDVVMPVMDGFQFLKILKSKPAYCKIPVIMLTIKSDPKNLAKGISLQTDFYLPKPFTLENTTRFIDLILKD